MASHPVGPGSAVPPSEWNSSSHVYTHGYTGALRAALIALVLLAVLAIIVLF